jgi:hypothetical protein
MSFIYPPCKLVFYIWLGSGSNFLYLPGFRIGIQNYCYLKQVKNLGSDSRYGSELLQPAGQKQLELEKRDEKK